MKILEVVDLHKRFPLQQGSSVKAVNGVNFSISDGETLGVVGESGCGKTTTGRCVVRLIEPTEGKVMFLGEDISRISHRQFQKLRPKIQIVFQEPYDALNPRKKVRQILTDPLIVEGKLDKKSRAQRVKEVLDMVELSDDCQNKYPVQLTQGEQQRIGVARSLTTSPQVIVFDEPTSLLDIRFRAEIIGLLERLQAELGIAYLFISHDLSVVAQLSHRIVVMYLGRIVEEGPTSSVFNSPVHPYTQALFSSALYPDPNQERTGYQLKGEVPSPVNLPDNRCNLAPRCPLVKDACYTALPPLREVRNGHFAACILADEANKKNPSAVAE